jgi:tetratricopeptide (TPR) repeat protein
MRKLLTQSLAVSCLFLALALHPHVVRGKDTWTSVQSKNFFLIGNGSEKDIKQVAIRLEQFREAFTYLFPNIKFNTPVPTTVIVFKSESSYKPFKPGPNLVGYFQPGQDVNYITLTTELQGSQDPYNVIFHEYTHLLVNNTMGRAPLWFNEGLAEYYSTFSMTNDQKLLLGRAIGNHVLLLRDSKLLPLQTLFEVDYKSPHYNERNKQSIFYAESWALVHYLLIGKSGRVDQLGKFIELLNTNLSKEDAFQQAFQMRFEAMEKELRNYVKQDRYNAMSGHFKNKLETDTGMQVAPLTEAEAQAYLGYLLLHSNRKESEVYLQKALELDPNLALANAAMGMTKLRNGKPAEALKNLEHAVQANSQSYLVHYYYAYALTRQNTGGLQPVSGFAPETITRIRQELLKSIELRPDFPASYSLLAFISLTSGDHLEEARTLLIRALNTSPGRSDLVFMLGQLYLRNSDFKLAKQAFEQVVKSNADDETRQHAQALLAQVVTLEEQMARFKQQSPPPQQTFTESVTTSSTVTSQQVAPSPSSWLGEVLRKPLDGETQVQGILLRIDCDAKGIFFVMKTGNQTIRLHTKTFEEMDITTYDTKVQGDITCGIRKPENRVVICFVPRIDQRLKVDGVIKSIEFVPADFKLKS